ncbi:MAG: helix-turn-helix domain-containing protein [Mesorhizobium sp.]
MTTAPKMLSTQDAAAYVGLAVSTMNKLRIFGGGPKYAKLGKSVRYSTEMLDEWIEENRRSSTSVAA